VEARLSHDPRAPLLERTIRFERSFDFSGRSDPRSHCGMFAMSSAKGLSSCEDDKVSQRGVRSLSLAPPGSANAGVQRSTTFLGLMANIVELRFLEPLKLEPKARRRVECFARIDKVGPLIAFSSFSSASSHDPQFLQIIARFSRSASLKEKKVAEWPSAHGEHC
jgi:hypothetical protein